MVPNGKPNNVAKESATVLNEQDCVKVTVQTPRFLQVIVHGLRHCGCPLRKKREESNQRRAHNSLHV